MLPVVVNAFDRSNFSRDNALRVVVQFHPKTDIDAALFQKAASERAAGQGRGRIRRKKLATANQHFGSPSREHRDLVQAVARADRKSFEIRQHVNLDPVAPFVPRPDVKIGGGWIRTVSDGVTGHCARQCRRVRKWRPRSVYTPRASLQPAAQLTTLTITTGARAPAAAATSEAEEQPGARAFSWRDARSRGAR